jgi:centrosomal protein CEP97
MTAQNVGFDYRPFVLHFCTKLSTIDGYSVSSSERDRSRQLFLNGHGCPFAIGQHQQLAQYLSLHCPLTTADNVSGLFA